MNEEDINEEKEKISAYLDDALPQTELESLSLMVSSTMEGASVDQQKDQKLGTASRYQLIGEVLRGQMSDASMIDVRLQVREALRNEHQDMAESVNNEVFDNKHSTRDSQSGFNLSWFNFPIFSSFGYRPLGGLAVAASVAMIMVFTVANEETTSGDNLVAEGIVENTPVVSAPVVNVASTTSVIPVGQRLVDQSDSRVNLETYLAEHAEFAAQDTMQGRMPYVRSVSYEAE